MQGGREAERAGTAQEMIAMLRRHYLPEGRPPAGIFAPEIQAPSAGRRADLIWLGVTAATNYELVGHEVKVSRGDVLAELSDLTKAHPWQRYCDRWWLVVLHPSLVEGLEVPPTWGVMTPPSGRRTRSMTIARPAPKLRPDEQAPAVRTLATWLHWRHNDLSAEAKRVTQDRDRARAYSRELEVAVPDGPHAGRRERQVVARILDELGGVLGDDEVGTWDKRVHVDDVIAALRDLGEVRRRREQVEQTIGSSQAQLRGLAERVQAALEAAAPAGAG